MIEYLDLDIADDIVALADSEVERSKRRSGLRRSAGRWLGVRNMRGQEPCRERPRMAPDPIRVFERTEV